MSIRAKPTLVATLTDCDREPIHLPGAILGYGAMLVLDSQSFDILQAGGRCEALLGRAPDALVGTAAKWLFGPDKLDTLIKLEAKFELDRPRHLLHPALTIDDAVPIDASLHRSGKVLILDLEPADLEHPHAADPIACVQEMIEALEACTSLDQCCQRATEQVRRVIGYDRVMLYRFLPDESGWVSAEDARDDLVPFLGLHYPASDIPVQARALYVKSPIRMIDDIDAPPAPLMPRDNPLTGEPLDLGMAVLRDVSPVHREYLRNMGVAASMSISVIRGGRLWGLISCHNYTPRVLPRHLRAICELFGSMLSLLLEAQEREAQFEERLASRHILQQLMRNLAHESDYAEGLIRQTPNLLDYIGGEGVALRVGEHGGIAIRINGEVATRGKTPTAEQIAALTGWLSATMDPDEGLFATDCLGDLWPPAQAFADVGAGLLAVAVSREPNDFILWFRPEQVQQVRWGGDPTKPMVAGPNGERLTPRKSFDEWVETVRGRAKPWLETDRDAAFDLRVSLLEVVLRRIEADSRERQAAYAQEQMVMAELDHRVKNTLANIQAIVRSTSTSADTVADFVEGLDGRIRAMSRAHSLLTASRWDGASIRGLLTEELAPFDGQARRILLNGPDATINPKAALALSLAIHELTTNAAKYGALSVPGGGIEIDWHKTTQGGIALHWIERGGPRVAPPTRRGFGSTLIGRALEIETGGTSSISFAPGGLECTIAMPAACVISFAPVADNDAPATAELAAAAAAPERTDVRILVVEDSALVLMTIEDLVEQFGWTIVGPAVRLDQALRLAREEDFDLAILDINLDGEMSWGVGEALKARGIPFMFSTGYDSEKLLPEGLAGTPVVSKPFRLAEIEAQLRALLGDPAVPQQVVAREVGA